MRLIDAEQIGLTDMEIFMCDGSYKKALEMLIDKIAYAPTIEVPQRMRGRWIEDGYNDEKDVCDQCGEPCATYFMGKPRDKYCKWCGADMRGTGLADLMKNAKI